MPFGACEKPSFSNLSFPESTGPAFKQQEIELVVQQNVVGRKKKKQSLGGRRRNRGRGREEEEEGEEYGLGFFSS